MGLRTASQICAPAAVLRVAVNADSLGTWFPGALARFAAQDGACVDVSLDDEVHTAEWLRTTRGIRLGARAAHLAAKGIDLTENGQALGAIREVGPGSHFLGDDLPEFEGRPAGGVLLEAVMALDDFDVGPGRMILQRSPGSGAELHRQVRASASGVDSRCAQSSASPAAEGAPMRPLRPLPRLPS